MAAHPALQDQVETYARQGIAAQLAQATNAIAQAHELHCAAAAALQVRSIVH